MAAAPEDLIGRRLPDLTLRATDGAEVRLAATTATTLAAARHRRRFGIDPNPALRSGSQFGTRDSRSGRVARRAWGILDGLGPDFEGEGKIHTDMEAAGAARNPLKSGADGLEVGPVLTGMANRAYIVTPGVMVRSLLDIAARAGMPVARYG